LAKSLRFHSIEVDLYLGKSGRHPIRAGVGYDWDSNRDSLAATEYIAEEPFRHLLHWPDATDGSPGLNGN
jgi:hypothetical protein